MNNLPLDSVFGYLVRLALASVLALIVACTGESKPEPLSPEGESALLQRVAERWQAMEQKDFAKTYEFTTPNYRRVFAKALYVNKFSYSVDWELTGVELLNYDAPAAVASVAVRVMSKPAKQTASSAIFGATPVTLQESWIFVDGEWWHNAKG
ncbi:MAG: hypothetical protein AB8B81_00015 [Halioglobus sp.]